jgi:ferrous iron transport protein A
MKKQDTVGILEMGHIELARAPCNQMLGVMNVSGDANWEKRFESMGIRKGGYLRKIANQPFGGPVVIEVNGSKISLSRNIALKIEVEVVDVSSH